MLVLVQYFYILFDCFFLGCIVFLVIIQTLFYFNNKSLLLTDFSQRSVLCYSCIVGYL